jgi:hypothetical protein
MTITRLQSGGNTSQDNTRPHRCCTKFEGVNNELEAVSSFWSRRVSSDRLRGEARQGCDDCDISTNANCKSAFLETDTQAETECMVARQFPAPSALGGDDMEVVRTKREDVYGCANSSPHLGVKTCRSIEIVPLGRGGD